LKKNLRPWDKLREGGVSGKAEFGSYSRFIRSLTNSCRVMA
jgi:hypothetical protein